LKQAQVPFSPPPISSTWFLRSGSSHQEKSEKKITAGDKKSWGGATGYIFLFLLFPAQVWLNLCFSFPLQIEIGGLSFNELCNLRNASFKTVA